MVFLCPKTYVSFNICNIKYYFIYLYISSIILQRESYYGLDPHYPREKWDMLDPMLISEGAFAAGMIFRYELNVTSS